MPDRRSSMDVVEHVDARSNRSDLDRRLREIGLRTCCAGGQNDAERDECSDAVG